MIFLSYCYSVCPPALKVGFYTEMHQKRVVRHECLLCHLPITAKLACFRVQNFILSSTTEIWGFPDWLCFVLVIHWVVLPILLCV